MDITPLQAAVRYYFDNGLAPATQKCYNAGQQRYLYFCSQADLTPIPTSENTMSLFAAHLALQGLSYTTIKVYFSSIGNVHSSRNQHDIYQKALTPSLEQVLKGIKREQAHTHPQRVCLPITVEILLKIYSVLSKTPTAYQEIMLWATCCTAFFGFLRVGEMTVPNLDSYDSTIHLSLGDIALDSGTSPTIIWLTIKQSKTDPFRKGAKLCLGITDSVVCPVKALLPYLAIRGTAPSPLFLSERNTPLTQAQFKTLLSSTLKKVGLDDSQYNTHSFRIGAATSAKAAGISDTYIQLLGRWKSTAFQGYIKTPINVLTKLSKQLASIPDAPRS